MSLNKTNEQLEKAMAAISEDLADNVSGMLAEDIINSANNLHILAQVQAQIIQNQRDIIVLRKELDL